MAKRKLTKEEVKAPDAFVTFSDQVAKVLNDNFQWVAGLVGTVLIVTLGWLGYSSYTDYVEGHAQEALFEIDKKVAKINIDLNDLQKDLEKKDQKKSTRPEKSPETLAKNYGAVLSEYEAFIKQNSGTKAAMIAAIQAADLYSTHKVFDKAAQTLGAVEGTAKSSDFFFGLVLYKLAGALTTLGKYDEAVVKLERIVESKQQEHLHSAALLKIGLNYEGLKDYKQAESYYQRVKDEFSSNSAGSMAASYLRLMKLPESVEGKK